MEVDASSKLSLLAWSGGFVSAFDPGGPDYYSYYYSYDYYYIHIIMIITTCITTLIFTTSITITPPQVLGRRLGM